MRENILRQVITDGVAGKNSLLRSAFKVSFHMAFGSALTAVYFAYATDRVPNDEMAKLAALASVSTGEPASTHWMRAHNESDWNPINQVDTVRRFLVHIDVDRCRVRQAPDADTNQREIWALSPSNSKY